MPVYRNEDGTYEAVDEDGDKEIVVGNFDTEADAWQALDAHYAEQD